MRFHVVAGNGHAGLGCLCLRDVLAGGATGILPSAPGGWSIFLCPGGGAEGDLGSAQVGDAGEREVSMSGLPLPRGVTAERGPPRGSASGAGAL